MKKKTILKCTMGAIIAGLLVFTIPVMAFSNVTRTASEANIPSETTRTIAEEPTEQEEVIVLEVSVVDRVETRDKKELQDLIDKTQDRIDAAKSMLDSATALGYEEENPVVVLANAEIANAQDDLEYYNLIMEEVLAEEAAAIEAQKWEARAAEYPTATKIWKFLTDDLGYNDYVAAGIMGNMMAEVGGQTLAIDHTLASGTYFGICQWKNSYYPSAQGASLDSQLNLLKTTIEGEYKVFGYVSGYSYSEFLNIQNEQTAALSFAKTYERCGSGSYSVRQKNASKALAYFTE